MAFIITMITNAIISDLETALDPDVIADAGESNLVRIGSLQDDPQKYTNPVLVYENDPDDPNGWLHSQYNSSTQQSGGRDLIGQGQIELGGTELFYRRFTVHISSFLTRSGLKRAQAKVVFDLLHGRCFHALRNSTSIMGLSDEFGESVLMCKNGLVKSRVMISGGPPSQWIGRIKLWLQVLTQLP